MSGPRYSIIPSRFFEDARARCAHFRVMGYLGKHSDKSGWMKLSQTKAAQDDSVGLARETINRAIRDLVDWGYVDKKTKEQTKRSICFYRILMDAPEEPGDDLPDLEGCDVGVTGGGCDMEVTKGCDVGGHRVVTSEVTRVVTSKVTLKEKEVPSLKINTKFLRTDVAQSEALINDLKVKGAPVIALPIQKGDSSWGDWMAHLNAQGRSDLAEAAEAAQKIIAPSRWPKPGAGLPVIVGTKPAQLSAASKRMTGERT